MAFPGKGLLDVGDIGIGRDQQDRFIAVGRLGIDVEIDYPVFRKEIVGDYPDKFFGFWDHGFFMCSGIFRAEPWR